MSANVDLISGPSKVQSTNLNANGQNTQLQSSVNLSGVITPIRDDRWVPNHERQKSIGEITEALKEGIVHKTVEVVRGKIILDQLDTEGQETRPEGGSTHSPLIPKAPPPTPICYT